MAQRSQLPTLAAVAALSLATQGCCRGWRAAAAATPPPLAVLLGRSPLPLRPLRPLLAWLSSGPAGPRRLVALHFEASELPGCCSGDMQRLAVELLGSAELAGAGARPCSASRRCSGLRVALHAIRAVNLLGRRFPATCMPFNEPPARPG